MTDSDKLKKCVMRRSSSINAEEYVFPSLQPLVDADPVTTYGPDFCTSSHMQVALEGSWACMKQGLSRQSAHGRSLLQTARSLNSSAYRDNTTKFSDSSKDGRPHSEKPADERVCTSHGQARLPSEVSLHCDVMQAANGVSHLIYVLARDASGMFIWYGEGTTNYS